MQTEELLEIVKTTLDENKGGDIKVIDVRGRTSVTDYMVLATGTSERHLRALSDHVLDAVKKRDFKPLGVEGKQAGDWVLVDLGDVVVHVMSAQTRAFYQLEKLWETVYSGRSAASA